MRRGWSRRTKAKTLAGFLRNLSRHCPLYCLRKMIALVAHNLKGLVGCLALPYIRKDTNQRVPQTGTKKLLCSRTFIRPRISDQDLQNLQLEQKIQHLAQYR